MSGLHSTYRRQGQSTLEFALIVSVTVLLLLLVVPLIQETFKQKVSDVHARNDATYNFNNGNPRANVDLPEAFLPNININNVIPNLPGFTLESFVPALGGLIFSFFGGDLMGMLGLGGSDTILGNAFDRGASTFITSGGDLDATIKGATIGGLSSAQFGRFADSAFDSVFEGFDEMTPWEADTLQANWGENVSGAADISGSYTQGFLTAYVQSDGDLKASVFGGVAQAWTAGPVQGWLEGVVGSSDLTLGAVNGGVTAGINAVGTGSDNVLLSVAVGAGGGALSSKTVQGALYGTDKAGNVMNKYSEESSYGGVLLGSGASGALQGALAYVGSGSKDPTILIAGAAISMVGASVSYADGASGFQQWRSDTGDDIKQAYDESAVGQTVNGATEAVQGAVDSVTGAVSDTVSSTATAVKETVIGSDNGAATTPAPAGDGGTTPTPATPTTPSAPGDPSFKTSESSTDSSTSTSTTTTTEAAPINPDNSSATSQQALKVAQTHNSNSTFTTLLGVSVIGVALFNVSDDKTGQSSGGATPTAPAATTSPTSPTPSVASNTPPPTSENNGGSVSAKTTSDTNVNTASPSSAPQQPSNGSGIPTFQGKLASGSTGGTSGIRQGSTVPRGNSVIPNPNSLGTRRLPQDVNTRTLASSKLANDLKAHRNQAVDVVKMSIASQLLNDYGKQLMSAGHSQQQVASVLQDPQTQAKFIQAVEDPQVLAVVDEIVDQALQDENFLAALEEAKGKSAQQQALLVQLKLRQLEREKTSRKHIYSLPEEKTLVASVLEKLKAVVQKLER